jgi:hypothetical protein
MCYILVSVIGQLFVDGHDWSVLYVLYSGVFVCDWSTVCIFDLRLVVIGRSWMCYILVYSSVIGQHYYILNIWIVIGQFAM